MKKNENIFVSLEIQKDVETKSLLLSVIFDRNAPNFFMENEAIRWLPTIDELDFIKEAFELVGGNQVPLKEVEEPQEIDDSTELDSTEYSHRSSEIRIAPLPNNMTLEVTENLKSSSLKNKEDEERIFIQADEKKIDEILKRKKIAQKQQLEKDSDDKTLIDRMMKQKKKK
jgi:hypothetical protein